MSGIRDLANKYGNMLKDLPAQREKLALIFAADAFALVANRIQNNGIGPDGDKFPLYSRNPIALFKYDKMKVPPGKLAKFKKDVQKGKTTSSYENFRRHLGHPVDKRDLTLTGDMFQSIEQVVTKHDQNVTEVTIRAKDRENQNKINYNSGILKTNILAFGSDEEDFIRDLNEERIKNIFEIK